MVFSTGANGILLLINPMIVKVRGSAFRIHGFYSRVQVDHSDPMIFLRGGGGVFFFCTDDAAQGKVNTFSHIFTPFFMQTILYCNVPRYRSPTVHSTLVIFPVASFVHGTKYSICRKGCKRLNRRTFSTAVHVERDKEGVEVFQSSLMSAYQQNILF